jgi:hypothetical protein
VTLKGGYEVLRSHGRVASVAGVAGRTDVASTQFPADGSFAETAQEVRVVNPVRFLSQSALPKGLAGVRLVVVETVGLDDER